MKRFFTLCAIMWLSVISYCQIVITEISYNPPEIGTDSLEYLELFNAGNNTVNLTKYKFSAGVELTFPETSLDAGKYLILAVKASAFKNVYGLDAIQWSSGALNNGGEIITLQDSSGNTVISIDLKDVPPWPGVADGTDGEGRSIEICNPLADPNNGENWKVSQNDLGYQINGKQVFGTPGAANSIPGCEAEPDFVVEVASFMFTPKDITIEVGNTVRWINKGGGHNINGTQATYPNNPESFGNGPASTASWTYDFKFTKPGFYNYQCDPHASGGMKGTVTVNMPVVINEYPARTIVQMNKTNGEGVADSLAKKCTLKGIVYGGNLRPTGLQFTIIDGQNHGIGVFNNSTGFSYTPTEGDEVEIKGSITQFRGLTQIDVADIKLLSSGNQLVSPKIVSNFVETDESSLIVIKNVTFKDVAQWTGTGSGFNVDMTDGTNEFSVRIVNAIDAYSMPVPSGNIFNVTGILTQFATTSTSPFVGGYQLQPRYLVDIAAVTGSVDTELDATLTASPNPTTNVLTLITKVQPDHVIIYNHLGQIVDQVKNNLNIDLSNQPAGLYVLKAIKDKKSSSIKVIKL